MLIWAESENAPGPEVPDPIRVKVRSAISPADFTACSENAIMAGLIWTLPEEGVVE